MVKYITVLMIIIAGCIDEPGGMVTSFLVNKSGHLVYLDYYKNGVPSADFSLMLNIDETKTVYVTSGSDGLFSYPDHISGSEFDSLVVRYGDTRKSIHCSFNKFCNQTSVFNFDSNRNLFNKDNWVKEVLKNTKAQYEAEYFYDFTIQDYDNAQQIQ